MTDWKLYRSVCEALERLFGLDANPYAVGESPLVASGCVDLPKETLGEE